MGLVSADVLGAGSYLLLGVSATNPSPLGLVARRGAGSMMLAFPQPMSDDNGLGPNALLDLAQPQFFTVPRAAPAVVGRARQGDADVFLPWWLDKWNRLLSELLDPATHRRPDGRFDPLLMLGRWLTVQRLVANVQAILTGPRLAEMARVELLFESLDLLHTLGWHLGSWDQLADPAFAEDQMKRLREEVASTPEVERVLIERCQRGADALVELRTGFRDGVTRGPDETNHSVHDFLRALRNAGHGFDRSRKSRECLVTLMGHHAYLHPDLPELAWLYLVSGLCFGTWRPGERRRAGRDSG